MPGQRANGGRSGCNRRVRQLAGSPQLIQERALILVTGSSGLIGSALVPRLRSAGLEVATFDNADDPDHDVRNEIALANAVCGASGIVHLAAVSRLAWAEHDPETTAAVNVGALRKLVALARDSSRKPWIVFASSREVYGEAALGPVAETAPLRPNNVYARSKLSGERTIEVARDAGLVANIVRFSNVFGSVDDHATRVVPAFAQAAASGGLMRVEGADHVFDFTCLADVVAGLCSLIEATAAGEKLEPVHLVSGRATTLLDLARMAVAAGHANAAYELCPPRGYGVTRFVGDPARARALLGWTHRTELQAGLKELIEGFRRRASGDLASVSPRSCAQREGTGSDQDQSPACCK